MTEQKCRSLREEATQFLRDKGYNWSGQPQGTGDSQQRLFDRRLCFTPSNGQAKWRRKAK